MPKHGHRIGYIRVSTVDRNSERQLDGIEVDKVVEEAGGAKKETQGERPPARVQGLANTQGGTHGK